MSASVKPDAEFKRFIALGQKIAKRLYKQGVEMKFEINFGPVEKKSRRRR